MADSTQALNFTHTLAVLNEFAKAVCEAYKKRLVQYDAIASQRLLDSVSANVPTMQGNKILVTINLMDYWKYIEAGRQAGKMPPISAIEDWISYKHIIPNGSQRGVPSYASLTPTLSSLEANTSTKSLAWAIATNIKKYGIKAKPILAPSVSETMMEFEGRIAIALAEDVGAAFSHIAGTIWSDVNLVKDGGQWQDVEVRDNIIL